MKQKTNKIPPKRDGSEIINIQCSICGKMFSEKSGHDCKDDEIIIW